MRSSALPMALLLSSALLFPACAAQPQTDTIERTFAAAAGGRLVIDTDRGSIAVEGTDSSEVRVEVERRVRRGSSADAESLLERHNVQITDKDGTVRIEAKLPVLDRWSRGRPQLDVAIRVFVPHTFHIDAKTAGGSVRAVRLEGEVSVRTSGGSLHLEAIRGQLTGRTSGGSIRASRIHGQLDLTTSGGSIHIDQATGTHLKARTSGGSIRLSEIDVPTEAHTSGGGLDIETATAPLDASTSGGSVRARFAASPKSNVSLRTSGGSITVSLPEDTAVQLDASTSAGSVRSDFPVTIAGKAERSSLRGPIGNGGPNLQLRTSAGSIRIQRS